MRGCLLVRSDDERRKARLRSRFGRVASAASLSLLFSSTATGYRFYPLNDSASLVPEADEASRWSDGVWSAGSRLRWTIADDPGWTEDWKDLEGETRPPPFGTSRDAEPFIVAALAAWSAIGSADIRWRLTAVRAGPGARPDRWNDITVNEEPDRIGAAGFANIWSLRRVNDYDSWEIVECDVVLGPGAAARMASDEPDSLSTLIHEFGHCIGLAHSAQHSGWDASWGLSSVWGETPKMSYGWKVSNDLTVDDIVGASLLRPATGWRSRVGGISGRITVAGRPARYVQVLAGRLDGNRVLPGPGAFTDETGYFVVEGLSPGRYLLRAGPLVNDLAHSSLLAAGAVREAKDGLWLDAVAVRSNEEIGGVEIEIESGRPWTRGRNP